MSTNNSRELLLKELGAVGRENSRLSLMFRQAVADYMQLHVTDAECIDFLLEAGSATPGELAKVTGLTSGAMTSVVDRLEKAGYVKRSRDKTDRRKILIKPVLKRIRPAEQLYNAYVQDAIKSLADFSEADLAVIIRHYEALSEVYSQHTKRIRTESL